MTSPVSEQPGVSGVMSGFLPEPISGSKVANESEAVVQTTSNVASGPISEAGDAITASSPMTKTFKERFEANLTDLTKTLTPQAESNRAITKANEVLENVAEKLGKNPNVSADEVFNFVNAADLDGNTKSRILFSLFGDNLDYASKSYKLKDGAQIQLNDTQVLRLKQQTTGNFVELCDRVFSNLTDFARKDSFFLFDSNQDKFGLKGENVKDKTLDFFLTGVFRNILNLGRINISKTFFDGNYNNLLSKKIHNIVAGGNSNKLEKGLALCGLGLVAAGFLIRLTVTIASFGFGLVLQAPVIVVGVALAVGFGLAKLAMKVGYKFAEKVGYYDQEFRNYHTFKLSQFDLRQQGTLKDFAEISPSLPTFVNLQVQAGVSKTLIDQIREAEDYEAFKAKYPDKSFFSFFKKSEPTE